MNFTNIKKIILLILISNIFYPLVVSAAEPWAGLATVSTNNKEDYNKYCNATGATDNVKMMRCDITVFDRKGIPTKFQFDAIKTSYTDFLLVDDRRNDVDVKLKLNKKKKKKKKDVVLRTTPPPKKKKKKIKKKKKKTQKPILKNQSAKIK